MQHTLKEQFEVVRDLYVSKKRPTKEQLKVLNTVGATLTGLVNIGESLIANSRELLAAAKTCNKAVGNGLDSFEAFRKLSIVIKSCEAKDAVLSKSIGVHKLKVWNGRGHGKFSKGSFYIAARSIQQATDMIFEVCGCRIGYNELQKYYNKGVWGTRMEKELKEVLELGYPTLYATSDNYSHPKLFLQIKTK